MDFGQEQSELNLEEIANLNLEKEVEELDTEEIEELELEEEIEEIYDDTETK